MQPRPPAPVGFPRIKKSTEKIHVPKQRETRRGKPARPQLLPRPQILNLQISFPNLNHPGTFTLPLLPLPILFPVRSRDQPDPTHVHVTIGGAPLSLSGDYIVHVLRSLPVGTSRTAQRVVSQDDAARASAVRGNGGARNSRSALQGRRPSMQMPRWRPLRHG